MRVLGLFAQVVLLYVLILSMAAFVVWLGPGFGSVNGQLVFLFCMVAAVPAAWKAANGTAGAWDWS
jgi:hypothetical protein